MKPFIFISLLLFGFWVTDVFALDMDLVSQGLDAYARENNLPESDAAVATTGVDVSGSEQAPDTVVIPYVPQVPVLKLVRKQDEFEAGIERYQYKYHEYAETGSKFMHFRGVYNGIFMAYAFRPADIDSMVEQIINLYRVELRYATGRVNYTGAQQDSLGNVTGFTYNGVNDFVFEGRGILGNEYTLPQAWTVTPYMGIGYRLLNNSMQEAGPGGYERESTYWYLPLGATLAKDLPRAWRCEYNAEYDYFISGKQVSHLEDIDPALDPLGNKQNKGFGWRTSLKVVKSLSRVKWSFEPYYRFWHIKKSSVEPWSAHGQIVPGSEPNTMIVGWEPDNITQELGLRLGAQF